MVHLSWRLLLKFWASILLCIGLYVSADVFWRQPADLPGSWQTAYTSPFASQGHEGTVTIYGTSDSLIQIGSTLRNLHGDRLMWMPGEVMAWAVAVEGTSLYRYLIQPRLNGEFWIAGFESDVRTAPAPGTLPSTHQLRDLPIPAGAIPTFYTYDKGNEAALEISEVLASPEGALLGLSEKMESRGWTPSPINTGGFRMFAKGQRIALIGVQQGKDGRTRILRLHKPLGVK